MKYLCLWIILLTGLYGCGPMNGMPPENTTIRNFSGNTTSQSSKNSHFLVFISNGSQTSFPSPQARPGDNAYVIRIVHADLKPLSSDAHVTLTYGMPDMPGMGKKTVTATHETDGTFRASLFFSMSGMWEVSLDMKDQGIEDVYVFTEDLQ